jgi:antitoxin (DNA-binding transcriptional repressor) of toxin-antitoxin stability system
MAQVINESQVAEQLSELLDRARTGGESFIIERGGQPLAALVPVPQDSASAAETVPPADTDLAEREEALLREMEAKGIITRPKPRTPDHEKFERILEEMEAEGLLTRAKAGLFVPFDQRPLIEISGEPLSETIIEERDRCI